MDPVEQARRDLAAARQAAAAELPSLQRQLTDDIPGWEGSIGPFRSQYGQPHVYARDIYSGAGNCVCGWDLGHRLHVQAAPGVDVPERMRW